MYGFLGMGAALALGLFALVRSRRTGGYYDAHVYAMTSRTHRAYAIISALFAAAFCTTIVLRAEGAAIAIFALFVLVAVFYLTSFLRGFSDDQE